MDELKNLYRCKEQIELELKQVAQSAKLCSKRFRSELDPKPKNKKFEIALLRLKARWNQSINSVFHSIQDTGIYDKLTHDLTKSFNTFYSKYKFDSDQLSFAFKCIILPVSDQIMQEAELAKRAYERQERRKYFLLKILSYGIEEKELVRSREGTPSLDGSVDVCSNVPITIHDDQNDANQRYSSLDSDTQHTTIYIRPTRITIQVVDVLVDALHRFTKSITKDGASGKDRIYQVMNITHIVDILKRYLNEIRLQIEEDDQYEQRYDLNLLEESFEEFKSKLWKILDLIDVTSPQTVLRSQLDILLMQFTSIKAMIRR